MGVIASIRERFLAAGDYQRAWDAYKQLSKEEQENRPPPRRDLQLRARVESGPRPRRDLQLEAIAEILRGDRVIHSHCYRQDEILALIRLADEMGIKIGTVPHLLERHTGAHYIGA